MIRRVIRVPRIVMRQTLGQRTISDRGQVADLLGSALRRRGYNPHQGLPARWGFGIIARRLKSAGPGRLHAVEAIHIGSSDPDTARAIATMEADDLVMDQAIPGCELDLRFAEILPHPDLPTGLEAINCYCISPIRVGHQDSDGKWRDLTTLVEGYSNAVNHTMQRRFDRNFHLQIIPDRIYVRSRKGNISAGFAIKTRPDGKVIVKRGIVMPFVLAGPPRDLLDAWYSGLGRTTGMGFGMLDLQS